MPTPAAAETEDQVPMDHQSLVLSFFLFGIDDIYSYRRCFRGEIEEGSIKSANILFYEMCSFDVRLIDFNRLASQLSVRA